MEELSVEEKAKRYDEALEKAKMVLQERSNEPDGASVLSYLFPELAESEDEKIRQLLLRFVKYDMSDNYSDDFTPADCVAWLEKQGKNNMGISEATKQKLKDNLNKALEKETAESFNEFLEKQGEQKPANWFQELEDKLANATPEQLAEWKEKYFKEEPAWSEEDEELLNTIINHFKVNVECTDDDDIIKWLKSLKDRVQPQSKQEWSGEDEKMFDKIIGVISQCYFGRKPEVTMDDIDWLKSLRPQTTWKPSESDIRILEQVIDGTVNPINYHATLYAILEQLKKLKG